MKTNCIAFLLCTILYASYCRSMDPASTPVTIATQDSIVKIKGIGKETAIDIAKKSAFKTDKTLPTFNVVACEEVLFWRIIFDGSSAEYVIDKKSGRIIKVEYISHGPVGGPLRSKGQGQNVKGIDEENAIRIAKRNLRAWYVQEADADWFLASACELQEVWRVIFDIRLTLEPGQNEPVIPSANTWQYSIDKKTGEILQKQKS